MSLQSWLDLLPKWHWLRAVPYTGKKEHPARRDMKTEVEQLRSEQYTWATMRACRRVELFLLRMSIRQISLWTNPCSCCNAHLLLLGLLDTVLGDSVVDLALSPPCCCWLSRRALRWYPVEFLLCSWGYVTNTFPRHRDSVGIILGSLK